MKLRRESAQEEEKMCVQEKLATVKAHPEMQGLCGHAVTSGNIHRGRWTGRLILVFFLKHTLRSDN